MEEREDLLAALTIVFERYQKNKSHCSPKELNGRYKKPFEELKMQLKENLKRYIHQVVVDDLVIREDEEGQQVLEQIRQACQEFQIGRKVGVAVFQGLDLELAKQFIFELRCKVITEIYQPYWKRHIWFYFEGEEIENLKPVIYQDILKEYYDLSEKKWVSEKEWKERRETDGLGAI